MAYAKALMAAKLSTIRTDSEIERTLFIYSSSTPPHDPCAGTKCVPDTTIRMKPAWNDFLASL